MQAIGQSAPLRNPDGAAGGQEPSDAEIDAAARALNPGEWWDWPNHAAAEQRSVWRGKARDALRAAAAVSGEQAQPDERCSFKAPAQWGVSGCLLPAGHPDEHEHVKEQR